MYECSTYSIQYRQRACMKRLNHKYIAVHDELMQRFQAEDYQIGQRLPTELELTKKLEVSRSTIRQALKLLQLKGIIEKRQGSGTFYLGPNGSKSFTPGSPLTLSDPAQTDNAQKGFIGLVNFNYLGYIYPEIVQGMEETLAANGYSLAIAPSNRDIEKEINSIQRLISQGVKGLIIEPSTNLQINESHPISEVIRNLNIPVVATHWGITNQFVSTVSVDDFIAGRLAAEHLLSLGHRRIGMVMKSDVQSGADRLSGYKEALLAAGITPKDEWCARYSNLDEVSDEHPGYGGTKQLLEIPGPPLTAIFYFNDQTAIEGYQAIHEAGLRIPEDISVIGFDNYQQSAFMSPPLTTFEHPKYDLGRWAAQVLLADMEASSYSLRKKIVFEPVLVERASTAPPRSDLQNR